MTLHLISSDNYVEPVFVAPPHSLLAQPQRPGDLCQALMIELLPERAEAARRFAANAGVPLGLYVVIAVEADRASDAAVAITGLARVDVEEASSAAAAASSSALGVAPTRARALVSYAAALRSGEPRKPEASTNLGLRLPLGMATSWSRAAAERQVALEVWVASRRVGPNRHLWEAAAAENGLALSEWVLVQAARRAASASAMPQMRAWPPAAINRSA